ncbi:MAG: hypothetical protein HDT43_03520 [Ruminococcaceae bacterium]|nr:hypothetical protein [Oscillospiraceae bacterium]
MISEKIKNSAEKAMPKEKRFIDGVRSFFGKKPHRLILSGLVALALLYPIYCMAGDNINDRYNVPMLALGFIQVTAAGAFFANIKTYSLKKYVCAVSVWSVVLYFAAVTLEVLSGMDTSDFMQVIPGWTTLLLLGIPICATLIALSVLFAYLVTCYLKEE